MRFRRMMVSVLAFWMVAMLLPTIASASDFRLRVENMTTGQGVVVTDQMQVITFNPDGTSEVAGDLNGLEGNIMVQLPNLGSNIMVSLTIGQTKPFPTSGGILADMFLNSITMTTVGDATVRLTLEDTSYPLLDPSVLQVNTKVLNLDFAAAAGSTLTTQSWVNPSNSVPALGSEQSAVSAGALPTIGAYTGTATSSPLMVFAPGAVGANSSSVAFNASGPFSLFTQLTLDIKGGGSLSFDQDTTVFQSSELVPPGDPTPEPGSLMLVATALLGLASKRGRGMLTRG